MRIDNNTLVTVQLNDEGIEILRQSYSMMCNPRIYAAGAIVPKIDDVMNQLHPTWRTGVVTMELWRWANVFGPGFNMMTNPVCRGVRVDLQNEFVTIDDDEIRSLLMSRSTTVRSEKPSDRLREVFESAQEAFWEVVATAYPEAKTGDFDPMASAHFEQACTKAIELWVGQNIEKSQ